ncbi:Trk system potassium transporter TrkA [Natranaerobius thermophilus]|uniref:Trk system potassium uptake protein TrkA n=1 Tax=Natranaerobius thermophilus (strain ATCC BAA-1301 / DSM 18059 / JW/NM-WN-LF) TaxID=457570 RepID=B2A8A9_NATTJ|nr:Trk system potassium transporter TrkA [Natranaerobius thermophilus]ACB84475.1 TrkA-C domain protein [Natranaerobius thermophilus JW/NM-WN-LF]
MLVTIIGGSQVGKKLAKMLIKRKHKVTLIEENKQTAEQLKKELDTLIINGSGANIEDLKKANVDKAKMIIALTENDTVNIVSCMLAKQLGEPFTISQVASLENITEKASNKKVPEQYLGIDYLISPQQSVISEIVEYIHFPHASDIHYFGKGKSLLLGIRVTEQSEVINNSLKNIDLPEDSQIIGIESKDCSFKLAFDDEKVSPGDIIYLVGSPDSIKKANIKITNKEVENQRIIIIGGKKMGYNLVRELEEHSKHHDFMIKVIEREHKQCEVLKRNLHESIVLESNYFNQEEILEANIVITVTGDDKTNIINSTIANQNGIDTISEITNIQYEPIYKAVGIESTVNPSLTTASQIMKFLRDMDIETMSIFQNGEAVGTEIVLSEDSSVINKQVSDLKLPSKIKIGAVIREEDMFIPNENSVLKEDDRLVIFTPLNDQNSVKKYLE